MIRRELAGGYPLSATLDESDRVSGGVYTLPSNLLVLRTLKRADADGDGLEQVALNVLRRRSASATPVQYAVKGKTIEIRGTPATDAEFELEYFGYPEALAADDDTNDLLSDHETIYKEGALFFLFKHTQDVELAQGALDTFGDAINKLNEAAGRKLGGASIAGAYNLFGAGGGY